MKWNELKAATIDPMWSTMGPPGRDGKDAKQPKDGQDGIDGQGFTLKGMWNRIGRYGVGDVVSV